MIKKMVIANLISYAIAGAVSLALVPASIMVCDTILRKIAK